MMSKELDAKLLRAMMMGGFDPTDDNELENKAVSNDLHLKRGKQQAENTSLKQQILHFEKLLDQAIVNNKKHFSIIHGKGKGVLRQELHKELAKHKAVKRFEIDKNNEGQTLVYLK